MPSVNYPGILVCAVLIFLLGGLWYSPLLFGKKWMALQGLSEEEIKARGGATPWMYLQVFMCGLFTAWAMSAILRHMQFAILLTGIKLAGVWWLGFAAATSYATALFSYKPKALWLIDSSFNLVSFLMAGIILTLWR